MAQSAVSAISTGCQMLKEGKAFIDEVKGEAEGVVGQLNEAKEQALGLWNEIAGLVDWAQGLWASLTGKPTKPTTKASTKTNVVPDTPNPRVKRKQAPQKELSYEEFQARQVHEICEQLKVYFEAMKQLKAHCRELQEASLTTENVAESAIDRIEIEWQMRQLSNQLKQAMIYGTPKELGLGSMYEEFLITYDEIVEAQEVAREVKVKKERDAKWQRELLKHHRIDRAIAGVVVMAGILWMWAILLSLGWLVKTPGGLLLLLLSSV